MNEMDLTWKRLHKEHCFTSRWFDVSRNEVILPNGNRIEDYYAIENQDAVMIVALDKKRRVVLKEEYRLPADTVLTELPAGAIEKTDASELDAAKRELLEETGFVSDSWTYLGASFDCPDRCTATLHLFLAENAYKKEDQHLDRNEVIRTRLVTLEEAIRMCMDGEIRVNSCAHSILKAARLLGV